MVCDKVSISDFTLSSIILRDPILPFLVQIAAQDVDIRDHNEIIRALAMMFRNFICHSLRSVILTQ